jgi:hypothetical protein
MTLPPLPLADLSRYARLQAQLLDAGYNEAAATVVRPLANDIQRGLIRQRLDELTAEAGRLADAGQKMRPDNPVFRAFKADLDDVLRSAGRQMASAGDDVAATGINAAGRWVFATSTEGVQAPMLGAIRSAWNVPDPEAVRALVNYVQSEAYRAEIAGFGESVLAVMDDIAVRGFVEGWGPLRTAASINQSAQVFPLARANGLMRSLQLTAWRDATALHQAANGDILEDYVIRIAALDDRTCMGCVALHGTRLPRGARVDDHRNGRCTSIAPVRGNPRVIQSGEDWFNGLDPERQRKIAGPGAADAIRSGQASVRDFARQTEDAVFGPVVVRRSLTSVLAGERDASNLG